MLGRKSLLAAENDTVDYDQRNIWPESFRNRKEIGLQELISDGHEAGNNYDIGGDSDLGRD